MAETIDRTLPIFIVDAFTDTCFSGNQAGVCPLPSGAVTDDRGRPTSRTLLENKNVYIFSDPVTLRLDLAPVSRTKLSSISNDLRDDTLQKIAAEMNFSETAFIKRLTPTDTFETGNRFGLRWFTPTAESKLCGHATLASAAILFSKYKNSSKSITFETLSGDLVVQQDGQYVLMDFPTGVTEKQEIDKYDKLLKALFTDPGVVEEIELNSSLKYLLIRIKDGWTRGQFEQWQPSIGNIESSVEPGQLVVVIVTTRGDVASGYVDAKNQPYDFVSRMFAPWVGILEDPVTGSAHAVLPYYWSSRLNKTQFYARQCSKRGGDVWITLHGERVEIKGKTAFVLEGKLRL